MSDSWKYLLVPVVYTLFRFAIVKEKIWKLIFFLGQEKLREFCGWSGKLGKNFESQGI